MWLLIARLIAKSFDFVLLLAAARLLSPAEFGIVALAMTFVLVTEAILEIPLAQALISLPALQPHLKDTAFTLSLLRALVISAVLVGAAPLVAMLYGDPRLTLLVSILALAPASRGLVSPRMALYARDHLDFRRHAVLEGTGKLVAVIAALTVAFLTRSYWALAVGTVAAPVTMAALSYVIAPYRPRITVKDWQLFADLVGWNTVSQFFRALNWQMDIFLLGRTVPSGTLGQYNVAQQLAAIPNQTIILPLIQPFVAAFSQLRRTDEIHSGYVRASAAVFTVSAPILVTLGLLAEPAVAILFNADWTYAAPILALLSFVALIDLPTAPFAAAAMSSGRTKYVAVISFIEFVFKVPLLIAGLYLFGIPGVIGAKAISRLAATITSVISARRLLRVQIRVQMLALVRPMLGLLALAGVVMLLRPHIDYSNIWMLVASTAGVAILGMASHLIVVLGLWRRAGSPAGIEAVAAKGISAFMRRMRRKG